MGAILNLAERFWNGAVPARDLLRPTRATEEIAPGVFFLHIWANVTLIRTEAGPVLVDTGNPAVRERTFATVRGIDPRPLAAAVYPDHRDAHRERARLYDTRARVADALMTRGIFAAAARDSAAKAGIELAPMDSLFSPRRAREA